VDHWNKRIPRKEVNEQKKSHWKEKKKEKDQGKNNLTGLSKARQIKNP